MKPNRVIQVVFVVVFLIVGPAPLLLGAVWTWLDWSAYRDRERELAGWFEAEAEITECAPSEYDPHTHTRSYPWSMQYTDPAGRIHHAQDTGTSCVPGRRYSLRCDPAAPEHCRAWESFVPLPLVLVFIGGFFVGLAFKEWRKSRRAQPAPSTP